MNKVKNTIEDNSNMETFVAFSQFFLVTAKDDQLQAREKKFPGQTQMLSFCTDTLPGILDM